MSHIIPENSIHKKKKYLFRKYFLIENSFSIDRKLHFTVVSKFEIKIKFNYLMTGNWMLFKVQVVKKFFFTLIGIKGTSLMDDWICTCFVVANWICMEFLDDPKLVIEFFENMLNFSIHKSVPILISNV